MLEIVKLGLKIETLRRGLVQSLFSPGLNIHRTHQVWRAHSGPRAAGEAGMSWHQKELKMRIFLGGGEDSRHISLVRTAMDVEMKEMFWVPFDSLLAVGLLTQGDFSAPGGFFCPILAGPRSGFRQRGMFRTRSS